MTVKNMEVYKRTEELLYKYYPRLINYPKSEKFSLCHSIKERFFELLKCISLSNSVKSIGMVYLKEADGHLHTSKVLVKLSKQRKNISNIFFGDVVLELENINKLLSVY